MKVVCEMLLKTTFNIFIHQCLLLLRPEKQKCKSNVFKHYANKMKKSEFSDEEKIQLLAIASPLNNLTL
jgi:hypothetical protein